MRRIDRTLYRMRTKQGGFTLIELMIVVAVIAVLTLIAYPSYISSVRKGKRGQAKTDLVTLAANMERCYTQTNAYTSPPCGLSYNTSGTNGQVNYNITLTVPNAQAFTITATPVGDQLKDPCGALSVDQAGNRSAAVTQSSGQSCF